ncbi:MAG: PAS domain-containing protein, partial [Sphingomicrobium sp.]
MSDRVDAGMYEAPDRYKRMVSARLPGGESLGLTNQESSDDGSPLRDVQLISRGQLAGFFAIANIVAMLFALVALWGRAPLGLLLPWSGTVVAANFFATRLARNQAITHVGRSGRKVPTSLMAGEVIARAALWLSLPTVFFTHLASDQQLIIAALTAALGGAALGLIVVPATATAWLSMFVGGLSLQLFLARATIPFQHMLALTFTLGVAVFGVLAIARWAFDQLKTNADIGSQSESASLLLQEYEQRGVGWLWQIDADNRVTYISSRMTALLGRPSAQILGHSLPSLLGGHAELGRVLLEKQTFTALEMELGTARGTRWISIAGDPIIDTAGRFEGFRGVGSDITEVRHTQERLTHLANVDVLSGLPNRGRVRQLLGEALRGAVSGNVPCAILFLDLDGFKPVNDT